MKAELDKTAEPCIFCGAYPKCVRYESNLYYYECSNLQCDKHPPYQYMGFRPSTAKEQWNWSNRPMKGVSGRNRNDKDFNL